MTVNTASAQQAASTPTPSMPSDRPRSTEGTPMNAATIARIAAWNVIADTKLPAGTKVTVKDGQVSLHPHGGRPAHVPYGPESTLGSLYGALKSAAQATAQADR